MANLLWVVYKMPLRGNLEGMNAVCEQSEWDMMELAKPGQYQLIQKDIASEGAAERLARGTSGDPVKRQSRGRSEDGHFGLLQRPSSSVVSSQN